MDSLKVSPGIANSATNARKKQNTVKARIGPTAVMKASWNCVAAFDATSKSWAAE